MGRPLIYGIAAAIFLVLIIAAVAAGEATFAIPIAILAVLVLGFFAVNDLMGKRVMDRHGGDAEAAQADDQAPGYLHSAHVITDEGTALGDSSQLHAEISPHDIPKDSPARQEAEAQAEERGGTTRGDDEGGDPERAEGGSKAEGYGDAEQPSSDKAKSVGQP